MTRTLVLTLVGSLALNLAACSSDETAAVAFPEVYVAPVVQQDVPIYMEIVGQTQGAQDVDIRARVEGFLDSIHFSEGRLVAKGDLLYQIDPKPLQATLAQAKADLATRQARLDQTTITVNRLKPLAEKQAVSLQELDDALASQSAAIAQLAAGNAAVEQAELNLGYTTITSPLEGIVGITQVKAGNLVGSGESTLLTTVSQVDPIVFRGGISEADYLRMARSRDARKAPKDEETLEIELLLADGTIYNYRGKLDAVERAVDPTTGTLAIQASFPNPERLLRPGQYGRIRFATQVQKDALLVLQRAVQELQDQFTIAVVGADSKISIRTVKVGTRVGDLWVITEGLKPGETVIVEGLQRLRDGVQVSAIAVRNSDPEQAANTANPHSPDSPAQAGNAEQ